MSDRDGDFDLLEADEAEGVGDEWEEIDVSDTAADRVARERDREFAEFRERITDADQFKVEASVFDDATYGALYKLVQDGAIAAFGGPISTGKEANVYTALGGPMAGEHLGVEADLEGGVEAAEDELEVAVKVYRINASDFRDMRGYLEGDPRFEGIGSDKADVVKAWVRKEYANLERADAAGVRVPTPIAVERNVLVMEYIGQDERAKRLTEVTVENPETAIEVVREYMRRLHDAGLIHGDLSPFNLVVHEGELCVIDLGQAITIHHPNADGFLRRDCENVANFFVGLGVETSADALYDFVTAESSDEEAEDAADDDAGRDGDDGDPDGSDARPDGDGAGSGSDDAGRADTA